MPSLSTEHPLKVAVPPDVFTGSLAQVRVAPGVPLPGVIERVTGPAAGASLESVRLTTGWGESAVPPTPSWGSWVNDALVGPLELTSNGVLSVWREPEGRGEDVAVAGIVDVVDAAVREARRAECIDRERMVAQLRAAPVGPVPLLIDKVTDPATGLPPASVRVTTGWAPKALPPAPPPGSAEKMMCEATPAPTLNGVVLVGRFGLAVVSVARSL